MRENEQPTVMPMRIMKSGFPPQDTVGRILIRHAIHGFMIGEMLRPKITVSQKLLCAVGIDTSPARNPICIQASGDGEGVVEWMPLIDTDNPADRVRANAAERRRNGKS